MNQDFLNALFCLYPDCKKTGRVTRAQVVQTMEKSGIKKWPTWLINKTNNISRGLYVIPGGQDETQEHTPVKVEQVKMKSVDVNTDESALIPKVQSSYVPFGNHKDIETIVKTRQFYPAYISGPTGNGKSTMVEQVCAKHKRGLIRVNMNLMTDEDALIGSKTLEDGNVKIVEGPVLIAMRMGIPLLLDEIDAGGANALLCLQPILEGKPYYFKLKNELIYPKEGFNIFATANTKGKGSEDGRYIGTNILNEAFLERFAVTFNQEYPTQATERKILNNLMGELGCTNEEFTETLVKWADAIRKTFDEGGIDETITTRRLIHIVRAYAIFKDEKKAVELCTNRFDRVVQNALNTLYESISKPAPETETSPTPSSMNEEIPF